MKLNNAMLTNPHISELQTVHSGDKNTEQVRQKFNAILGYSTNWQNDQVNGQQSVAEIL